MSGEIEHLLGQLQLGDVVEVLGFVSNFIRIAQRQAQQAAIPWFERDDVLAACEHDAAERHHVHLANGVTDDGKGILSDLTIRRDVVRRVDIALVDLALRNELVDVDGPRAFNLNGLELLVLDKEILALADLIASRNVLPRDGLAGLGIHVLLLEPVSGLSIDAIETDFFPQRRGRVESDRARNEGKPKVALPIRARGHGVLLQSRHAEPTINTLANALEPTIHVCGRSLQKSRITTRTVMGGTADV